jgi:hypothetical protein
MIMNFQLKRVLTLTLISTIGLTLFYGCRKKKDTIAIILVKDVNSQPVSGAEVVLYGKSTTNQPANVVLYDTTSSNSDGNAIFNFNDVYQLGQAGVAILNIKASKYGATGEGIIKIVEETTSEETVFIQ